MGGRLIKYVLGGGAFHASFAKVPTRFCCSLG